MVTSLNEQATESASTAETKCGICKRTGFPLFLVRKSILPVEHDEEKYWSQGMNPDELKGRIPDETLEAHEYAYRTIREGYIYVFVKRRDVKGDKRRVIAFESLPKGGFRHRSIEDIKEQEIEDIPNKTECVTNNHRLSGLFLNIDIDPTFYQEEAWIAYSRRAWSHEVRKYYQNAPESELGRFTKITFNEQTAKSPDKVSTENRSFAFESFLNGSKHLVEFETELLQEETRANIGKLNSFNVKSEYHASVENKTKTIINKLQKNDKKIAAVVIEDCFGLANDLNCIRTRRLAPYFEAMIKSEKQLTEDIKAGVSKALALNNDKTNKDLAKEEFDLYRLSDPMIDLFYKKPNFTKLYQASLGVSLASAYSIGGDDFYSQQYNEVYQKEINYQQVFDIAIKNNHPLSNYFAKEMVYKRKIRTWIDNYKAILKSYYAEINKDNEIYIYFDSENNAFTYPETIDRDNQGNYEKVRFPFLHSLGEGSLYKELPISIEQEQELIGALPFKYSFYHKMVKVKRYSTSAVDAERQFTQRWNTLSEKINQETLDTFNNEDQQYYQELLEKITAFSKDYFVYLTWLLGGEHKSKYAYNLKSYNTIKFWEFEFAADGSNEHLGFLSDVGDILSMSYTGTIKLPEQFGIWDTLFNSDRSLYFYALTGKRDPKVAAVNKEFNPQYQAQDTSLLAAYQQAYQDNMTEIDNSNRDRNDVIKEVVNFMNNVAERKWNNDNVTNFMLLYQRAFNNALEGITNSTIKLSSGSTSGASTKQLANFAEQLTNRELVKAHFQSSTQLLQTIEIKVARLQLSPKEFVNVLQNLIERKVISITATPGEVVQYKPAAGQKSVGIKIDDKGNVKLFGKTDKFITTDVVIVAKTAEELSKIEQDLALDRSKDLARNKINDMVGAGDEAKKQALDAKNQVENERNQVKVDATKALVVNSALLVLDAISFWNTLEQLQKADEKNLGIAEKNLLSSALIKASLGIINNSVEIIGAAIKFYSLGGFSLYAYGKEINYLQPSLAGDVTKICSLLAKGTASVLAVWSVLDGASGIADGIRQAEYGDPGGIMYSLGSSFQIASGIYTIIALFYSVPYLGQIMFVIGLIGAVLTYIFKDKAADWSLMERWLDLCYFGKRYTQGKEAPYPLNPVGLFLCLNHYFTALNGASAVIDIGIDNTLLEDKQKSDVYARLENAAYAGVGAPINSTNKALYLKAKLPNFDDEKSFFKGSLFIETKGANKKQSMVLEFQHSKQILKILPLETSLDSFILREELSTIVKEREEQYSLRNMIDRSDVSDDFVINLKLGEIQGFNRYILKLTYWPEGEATINNDDSAFPLLLNYDYQD